MIIDFIKACFVGPIAYRVLSGILIVLVVYWIYWGIRIAQHKEALEIFYLGTPVNGKTITVSDFNRFIIPLDKIYIKNTGRIPAKGISIKIHFSEELKRYTEMWESQSGSETTTTHGWSISNSMLEGYISLLEFSDSISLNPEDSWNRRYRLVLNFDKSVKEMTSVSAKVSVYYGEDKPLEVDLILKPAKEES